MSDEVILQVLEDTSSDLDEPLPYQGEEVMIDLVITRCSGDDLAGRKALAFITVP